MIRTHQDYDNDQVKNVEMVEEYGTHEGGERGAFKVLVQKSKENGNFDIQTVHGRVILRTILKKWRLSLCLCA
jgi:hypothetical protein